MPYLQDLGYTYRPTNFFLNAKITHFLWEIFQNRCNKLADQPVLVNVSLYVHKTKTDYLFLSTL